MTLRTTKRLLIVLTCLGLIVVAVVAGTLARRVEGPGWLNRLASRSSAPDGELVVVASTFPLYDFARTIADGVPDVTVANLLPFNVGPHDFSPTPETTALVASADVIAMNGLGLDTFTDKLREASGNRRATVVVTTLGITTLSGVPDEETRDGVAGSTEAPDPHVWMNPRNAALQVQHIRDALIAADPAHRTAYERNAGRYVSRLNALDAAFEQALAAAPTRALVTFHPAFRYLAQRYGLEEVAVFEDVPGREPSAQALAATILAIRQRGVTTVFTEPQFSPKLVETVARDLRISVEVLDPIETAAEHESYLAIMGRNLEALRRGLR